MCFFIIIIVKVSHTSNANYAKIKPLHVFVHAHERHSSVEVSFMPTYVSGKKPPLKHQYLNGIKPHSAELFFFFFWNCTESQNIRGWQGPQQIVQSTSPHSKEHQLEQTWASPRAVTAQLLWAQIGVAQYVLWNTEYWTEGETKNQILWFHSLEVFKPTFWSRNLRSGLSVLLCWNT